jgi:hypothetical protein
MHPRKTKCRFPFLVAAACLLCLHEIAHAGEYTNAFLDIGIGPRALGMGGAFCSIADDGHAFYWNPAGLALMKRPILSAMYGPQFGSVTHPMGHFHFIGYAQPLRGAVLIGINWIRLSVDDIPVFPELQGNSFLDRLRDRNLRPTGDPDGYLNDVQDALFFSFSKRNELEADLGWLYHRVKLELPVGVNLKWIRHSMGAHSATGLGVDIGVMARLHLNDLFQSEKIGWFSVGLHFQDITKTAMRWDTRHQDSADPNVKFGLSYECPLPLKNNLLHLAFDRDSKYDGINHFGLEYQGFRTFSIRIGSDDGRLTCGAGIRIKTFEVNYAFLNQALDSVHRIGCSLAF